MLRSVCSGRPRWPSAVRVTMPRISTENPATPMTCAGQAGRITIPIQAVPIGLAKGLTKGLAKDPAPTSRPTPKPKYPAYSTHSSGTRRTAQGFHDSHCTSAISPVAASAAAARFGRPASRQAIAARPVASCQWPLRVCAGMFKPATARWAKNGITRRAISSVSTAMHSRPALK
ncbi:hypothetical protein D3C72_1608140 [compost metagenome]